MNGTDHSENKLASEGFNEGLFEFMKLRFEERVVKPCGETQADMLCSLRKHTHLNSGGSWLLPF